MAERLGYKVIPFVGQPQQRATGTGDQRYVNVLFERVPNDILKEHVIYCVKRGGVNSFSTPSGTSTGRGIYSWMGSTHSVFGNVLWTGSVSTAMNTSSGRAWFHETHVDTGTRQMIVCDGIDDYDVTSSNVVTRINAGNATNYPVSSLGSMAMLDGYNFRGQSNGRLINTRLNTVSSWNTGDFLTADTFGGSLEAIYQQKDQILGLTKNRIEFFFNNGNPTGSPLLRYEQNTIYVGLASKESLASYGEEGCFVGENAGGGRSVYRLASVKMGEISTPVINRFLNAEGLSISSCTAWMAPVSGQLAYCLNLQVANRSFVFGMETQLWSEWTSASGNRFNCVSAAFRDGTTYLQDTSSGQIHSISTSFYQDNASSFTVTLQTPRQNFGTPYRKTEPELSIFGDTTLGNMGVSVSDDDYQTFDTARNIDMSLQRKRVTRLGSFYERAHKFTYTGTSSFRVQAYAINVVAGRS